MRMEDLYPTHPRQREKLPDRFWSKVDVHGNDECWPWTASLMQPTRRSPGGYGRFGVAGVNAAGYVGAHRVAYMLAYGEVPDDLAVCHSCDNLRCCNPAHLWVGTKIDNNADRDRKGRYSRAPNTTFQGQHNGSARLTEHDVRRLRRRYRAFLTELARQYEVSDATIQLLLERKTWKHVKLGRPKTFRLGGDTPCSPDTAGEASP
jgi:hypothetical protein